MSGPNSAGKLNDIVLHHLLEIIVYESVDSIYCTRLFGKISEYYLRYIYTSCVLNLNTPEDTLIGTKVFLFISDQEADEMAKLFDNTYVIDLNQYGPVQDAEFRKLFFHNGHMTACGYKLAADVIMSYIDYLIRHHMEDFKLAGMIGYKK